MTIDKKSLGYRIIVPSLAIIVTVFFSLIFLIRAITTSIQDDYDHFTITAVSGEVQKVLSSAASDLTAARLAGNPVVMEAKQKSVREALTLLWPRMGHDGIVTDTGGSILFSTLSLRPAQTVIAHNPGGYYRVSNEYGGFYCYAETFPMWGWKVVTVSQHKSAILSRNKVASLIPLVVLGCLLMVGGIFLVIRKTLQNPVNTMVASVSREEKVELTGLTEFDVIGAVVNDAFQRLKDRTEALQNELVERNRIQKEIRAKDEHIHRLLNFTEEGIFGIDLDGICTFCNRSCLSLLGYDQEEQLLGIRIHDLIHHSHKDGTPFPGHECSISGVFNTGGYAHVENEVFWRADGSSLQAEYWSHPINEDGIISGAVVTFIDIGQRKLLEDQLIQAQKMESVGRLAGGVAHDFNNLLTPIIGYTELLQRDLSEKGAAHTRLSNILKAAENAKELVQQLLSFSRKQVMDLKVIDLNRVISDFQSILRRTIRESIDLHLGLTEVQYGIRADRNQIEQVIMNLVVNAQDAINEHGVITIETAPVLLDDEYARQHIDVNPGQYLMLAISDDGCGMNKETRQRVFEPFFTTKGIGKGTGLGLATVYGIVRQHNGNIWVYSEPDKGTTFKCFFPLVDEKPINELIDVQNQMPLAGDQRTILLVEDNEMVRSLVDELLTQQGFNMIVAQDPKQALQLIENRTLDLLITDVVMPHMSGPELHAKLLKNYPGLRVLYMSGYTSNTIAHQGVLDEGTHFVQKPFAINEFAQKVEKVMISKV